MSSKMWGGGEKKAERKGERKGREANTSNPALDVKSTTISRVTATGRGGDQEERKKRQQGRGGKRPPDPLQFFPEGGEKKKKKRKGKKGVFLNGPLMSANSNPRSKSERREKGGKRK